MSESSGDVFFYVWGFGGEQFKFEMPQKVFQNSARELYILFESSKQCSGKYDFETDITSEIGVDWKDYLKKLFFHNFKRFHSQIIQN